MTNFLSLSYINLYSKLYTYEYLLKIALEKFMKLLFSCIITLEIFSVFLSLLILSLCPKHEENKIKKLMNINLIFTFINYIGFNNIDKVVRICEYLKIHTSVLGYTIIIFIVSVLLYITVFGMGFFTVFIIKENIFQIKRINEQKDK